MSSRLAASKVLMRSGRHFAEFTVVEGDAMHFGVILPEWDVAAEGRADIRGPLLLRHERWRPLPFPRAACIFRLGGAAGHEREWRSHRACCSISIRAA